MEGFVWKYHKIKPRQRPTANTTNVILKPKPKGSLWFTIKRAEGSRQHPAPSASHERSVPATDEILLRLLRGPHQDDSQGD